MYELHGDVGGALGGAYDANGLYKFDVNVFVRP